MAKLWGGRFKKGLDDDAKDLSYTVHIDKALVHYDLLVNKAHAMALTKAGVLSESDLAQITTCLAQLDLDFKQGSENLIEDDEDIHSCVERLVTQRLGDLGKKMHTGKSRNDQVIADFRLYLMDVCDELNGLFLQLMETLFQIATRNKKVIFAGMTHFQPAQPVLFAHHMLAYFEKFQRDMKRFKSVRETCDVCPLGSGALAGNNYGLDRELVAKEAGFSAITQNSMDAVSDRDFAVEFMGAASLTMTHLSRLCEEIIVWNSPLLGFISLGDDFTTGSSIMPQKKNPDIAELIRGKSGRVVGNLMGLHHVLKSLPLTYNRDLQEDKEMVFDAVKTIKESLLCMSKMLQGMTLNQNAIDAALKKGYLNATEFADYLVQKDIPFRQAHEITGEAVLYAIENNKNLEELTLKEFQTFSEQIDESVFEALTLQAAIDAKNVLGGTASQQVEHQLKRIMETYTWKKA